MLSTDAMDSTPAPAPTRQPIVRDQLVRLLLRRLVEDLEAEQCLTPARRGLVEGLGALLDLEARNAL